MLASHALSHPVSANGRQIREVLGGQHGSWRAASRALQEYPLAAHRVHQRVAQRVVACSAACQKLFRPELRRCVKDARIGPGVVPIQGLDDLRDHRAVSRISPTPTAMSDSVLTIVAIYRAALIGPTPRLSRARLRAITDGALPWTVPWPWLVGHGRVAVAWMRLLGYSNAYGSRVTTVSMRNPAAVRAARTSSSENSVATSATRLPYASSRPTSPSPRGPSSRDVRRA
jgi:hypothetical protein